MERNEEWEGEQGLSEDDFNDDLDGKELFNQVFGAKKKTPFDGIRELWTEVLVQAVGYAKGQITNDHDCGGKEEVRKQFVKSSVRFLQGNGNLDIACQAAGVDTEILKQVGKQYGYLLHS
jgi:hypothetical protein